MENAFMKSESIICIGIKKYSHELSLMQTATPIILMLLVI